MIVLSSRLGFRASLLRNFVNSRVLNEPTPKCLANHITPAKGLLSARSVATSTLLRCNEGAEGNSENTIDDTPQADPATRGGRYKKYVIHPVETSIRYMRSNAYKRAYGEEPVWVPYRRNFKGQFAPETRESCVRQGVVRTGSPCPICRDEYLVLHYKNTALLEQFISPTTGETLKTKKTGICQKAQLKLELEIMKAYDIGTLSFEVPLRRYKYKDYYTRSVGFSEPETVEDKAKPDTINPS